MTKMGVVEIDGDSWYIPIDRIDEIVYINGMLTSNTSSSITMYKNIQTSVDYNNYPRITCAFGSACRLYLSSGQSYTYMTSVDSFNVVHRPLSSDFFTNPILLCILGVLVIWKYLQN